MVGLLGATAGAAFVALTPVTTTLLGTYGASFCHADECCESSGCGSPRSADLPCQLHVVGLAIVPTLVWLISKLSFTTALDVTASLTIPALLLAIALCIRAPAGRIGERPKDKRADANAPACPC
jgi:hypothetical protein